MRPSRRSSSTSSSRCESAPSRTAPNKPARPFSVWTARKASLISEGSLTPALSVESRLSRFRDRVSMISCASEKNSSRALSESSAMRLGLHHATWQQAPDLGLQGVLRERLDQVAIRAESQAARPVALGRLSRDDQHRSGLVRLALADEGNQLETIDIGHVDVRN